MNLRTRSHQPEMMDEPGIPVPEMRRVLRELDVINRWLGGYRTSLYLLGPRLRRQQGVVRLLDVGSGGTGTARWLVSWAERHGVDLEVTLLDIHPAVCAISAKQVRNTERLAPVQADAVDLPFADGAFHFAHAALFLHHFRDETIDRLLAEMRRVSRNGVVVNDLHRHRLAFHAIRLLTRFFGRSPIVRNDAPLSVLRGFRRDDLSRWRVDGEAAIGFRRRWAFRWAAWAFSDGGTPRRAGHV